MKHGRGNTYRHKLILIVCRWMQSSLSNIGILFICVINVLRAFQELLGLQTTIKSWALMKQQTIVLLSPSKLLWWQNICLFTPAPMAEKRKHGLCLLLNPFCNFGLLRFSQKAKAFDNKWKMCTHPCMQTSKIDDCEISNHSEGSQMKVVRKSKRLLQEVAADKADSDSVLAPQPNTLSLQHIAKVNCWAVVFCPTVL